MVNHQLYFPTRALGYTAVMGAAAFGAGVAAGAIASTPIFSTGLICAIPFAATSLVGLATDMLQINGLMSSRTAKIITASAAIIFFTAAATAAVSMSIFTLPGAAILVGVGLLAAVAIYNSPDASANRSTTPLPYINKIINSFRNSDNVRA